MTTPATAPKPAAARPNLVAEANKAISAVKTHHDYARPFRYIYNFTTGTLTETLDGIAIWGRNGLKMGAIGGATIGLAMGSIAPIVGLGLAAFTVCAAVGGALGLLTGGAHAVARQHRGEKYAEDLVVRSKIQKSAGVGIHRADYRQSLRDKQIEEGYKTQFIQARMAEEAKDTSTYWRDREERTGGHRGHGGHGF